MSAWSVSLLCRRCHSKWNFNYTIHFPHSDGVTMLEKTHSLDSYEKTSVERQSKIKCGKTHISELSIERSHFVLLPPRTSLPCMPSSSRDNHILSHHRMVRLCEGVSWTQNSWCKLWSLPSSFHSSLSCHKSTWASWLDTCETIQMLI